MKIVILGLSITSTWGNGHATTYRSLLQALAIRGHEILFLERDMEWYARKRDMPRPPFCRLGLYENIEELKLGFRGDIRSADFIIIGSYVPEGIAVAEWVIHHASAPVAFYDIDTPVTLANLDKGKREYLSPELISGFDLYLSFSGGPLLDRLKSQFGAQMVRPLFCSADPAIYYPQDGTKIWDIGYIGTFSADRQRKLEQLLLTPANMFPSGRFALAGSLYPREIHWPANLQYIPHLPYNQHRRFYNQQRFTLNLTRAPMVEAGYSPSVRLFEAAACATAIMTDTWPGLESFFEPGKEILVVNSVNDVLEYSSHMPASKREEIGKAAFRRFQNEHAPCCRAALLEDYISTVISRRTAAA
jgi:spore maturation protein CgeB